MPSNNTENIYSTPFAGEGEPVPATKISYDNTVSHLTADRVQAAIDELAEGQKIVDISDDFFELITEGVSVVSSNIFKRGKHVFGTLVITYAALTAGDSFTVGKPKYKPVSSINTYGTVSVGPYGTIAPLSLAYLWIENNGVIIADYAGGSTFAKITVDYICQ